MADDLAMLGLGVDSRPVAQANIELDKFSTAAKGAEQSAQSFGAGSSRAMSATQELARNLQRVTQAHAAHQRTAALSSQAMANLAFQINDVATMAALGADPLRILATQAGQFYQVLSMGEGGVRGSLTYLKDVVTGMITPLRLAATGFGVLGVTAAAALHAAVQDAIEIETALSGVGRESGLTSASIRAIAAAAADARQATVGEAQSMLVAFASTGKIGPEVSAQLIEVSRRFAATFGEDMPEAAARMAKAFSDPTKGLDELNKRLGVFDDRTRQAVLNLVAQNRTLDAQKVMMAQVKEGLVDHIDATSRLGRAWQHAVDDMSKYWADLKERVSEAVGGKSLDKQIQDAKDNLNNLLNRKPGLPFSPGGLRGLPTQSEIRHAKQVLADLEWQKRKLELDDKNEKRKAEIVHQINEAADAARRAVPEFERLRSIVEDIADLQRGLLPGPLAKSDPTTLVAIDRALEMRKRQLEWMGKAIQNGGIAITQAQEEHNLALKNIDAHSTAQRAAIAYQQEYIRLRRDGDPDAEARAEMKRKEVLKQSAEEVRRINEQRIFGADQAIEVAGRELTLVGQTTAARERELALLSIRHQLEEEALRNEGNRNAYDPKHLEIMEDRVRWQIELNRRLAEETTLRDLAFERAQMGRSERDQGIYSRLNSLGLLTNGEVVGAQAELIAGQIRFNEVMRISQDSSKEFASGFIRDMRDGVSATEALANAMNRLADRFLDMAMDQGFSALFKPFSQAIAQGATGVSATDTLMGWGATVTPSVFHRGGTAGDPSAPRRAVPASAFTGARRYHSGGIAGLGPDEVPAILQKGEPILPRGTKLGGGVTVAMPVTINAPGADAAALARVEATLRQMQRELPATILNTVRDGRQRNRV